MCTREPAASSPGSLPCPELLQVKVQSHPCPPAAAALACPRGRDDRRQGRPALMGSAPAACPSAQSPGCDDVNEHRNEHAPRALLLSSCYIMPSSLQPRGWQHTRLPCPSPSPGACSDSSPLDWRCHPAISSSVVPFSPCPQSLPASGSFPMSQLFTSGGQSIGASASASVLPLNIQG